MSNPRGELQRAIRLREGGEPEAARRVLLDLVASGDASPEVLYQCAWAHDVLGREQEAAPFYERAIAGGLDAAALQDAIVGLGSTYRVLGEYGSAVRVLTDGMTRFPENRAIAVFLAMALYNVGEHREAMRLLLANLAQTTSDATLSSYSRAIAHYAENLDETVG